MRVKYVALCVIGTALVWGSSTAHAETIRMYAQTDDSGEILSQQATYQSTWIGSDLGNLALGKESVTLTFTIKDPNAGNSYHTPAGVALGSCSSCPDLQTYYFTDEDRALLSDGEFHTFTVETGTTTLGVADGENPIYIVFFGLSQYHLETHVKSNAAGTAPYLIIEGTPPASPELPQVPAGTVTIYSQNDGSGVMTNPQTTFLSASVDSASLGNLNLGQGELYITFTMKDPYASNRYGTPVGICMQPAGTFGCSFPLQTYFFTDADRTLLADQAFHTFVVKTGTTTSTYADGTQPVSIGFAGLSQIQYGTKIRSNADATIPRLIIQTTPSLDSCSTSHLCVSNVLFLPGIEGSRLYEGAGCGKTAEEKLWEPFDSIMGVIRGAGDDKVKDLFLDSSGESVCSDIYAKGGDIIDSAGGDIYKSFIAEMNGLKADGTINDWEPIAYDWRLSLDDLLNKGLEQDGKIYYEQATSTPYIEQELRALAATSKTGKVTIVAHSNGGLVAKALLNRLGSPTSKSLVDKVVMVGAPQSGASADLGAVLLGYDAGIYADVYKFKEVIKIVSNAIAQQLAENSPMAYHLLPSQNYFNSVASDTDHPIARFAGDGYAKEISAYGGTITNSANLDNFLLTASLNSTLINYANRTHTALDTWVPPAGVEVDQIAGWGVDTVSGIDFYTPILADALTALKLARAYRPIFTEDGDGTVTIPSALLMSGANVNRYWLDLFSYNNETKSDRKHKDIFEIPSLQNFIKNIIENSTSSLPTYISTSQPPPNTESKELTFFLHSPLTLQLTDANGNVTGLVADNSITQNIPGSTYGEFGDVKYITVPCLSIGVSNDCQYQLTMHGQDSGAFSLDMQETTGGVITASSTIANVPTNVNTIVTLNISGGINAMSMLTVDEDGDGKNIITINPVIGETVNYVPPLPIISGHTAAPVQPAGSISIPVIALVPIATSSTQIVATSTPVVAIAKSVLVKKKALISIVPPKKVTLPIPQTASVYGASQQSVLKQLGTKVYNSLYGFWATLKKLF